MSEKLSDNDIRDINEYLEQGKPLPDKYRFMLFGDKREVELVWNGKTNEVTNVVLPFQAIEKIDPRSDLREKYQNKTIIAFIGRLIEGKGAHDLITAIAQLKRDDIVTFIIGGGPEEKRLRKQSYDHALDEQIVFFRNQPFEQAISILKTADIVVNPSYTEGLPTSVTEAALCKKAIIATNVGGTSEVITGNDDGYLLEPRNIERLKEALTTLIENPEKRLAFGQKAYQGVKNKFDWNESTKKYLAVFNEVLDNKKQ